MSGVTTKRRSARSAAAGSFGLARLNVVVALSSTGRDAAAILHRSQRREYSMHVDQPVISCSPDVMGGTPVFAGTRVPVQTLLDYLEAGESIDEFLAGFPSVSRDQVIKFLEQAKDRLVAAAS